LKCRMVKGEPQCTLTFLRTNRTEEVHACFKEIVCKENRDLVIYCDYAEAKDGGKDFLLITDIVAAAYMNLESTKYGIRYEFGRVVITDSECYDPNCKNNTYRCIVPPLFHISEISDVFNIVIPNFYAKVCGVRLFKDGNIWQRLQHVENVDEKSKNKEGLIDDTLVACKAVTTTEESISKKDDCSETSARN